MKLTVTAAESGLHTKTRSLLYEIRKHLAEFYVTDLRSRLEVVASKDLSLQLFTLFCFGNEQSLKTKHKIIPGNIIPSLFHLQKSKGVLSKNREQDMVIKWE